MLRFTRNIVLCSFLFGTAFAAEPVAPPETNKEPIPAPVESTVITTDPEGTVGAEVSAPTPASTAETQDTNLVEFNIIDNGTISGAKQDTAMLHIFTDNESWQTFWKKHMTVVPAPPAPAVDFEDQQVLAIIDSDQPNSGYYISLERIEIQNGELWVYATREQPGPGCMSLGMVAQPYVIVTIDKSDLPAKLLLSTRTYDC